MKNIIIGTAGHIDHGKTTLIKALTGRNTDRWEEEQRRGIYAAGDICEKQVRQVATAVSDGTIAAIRASM